MTDDEIKQAIEDSKSQQKEILDCLKNQASGKGKDRWDKFSTLSTFLSSVLLAGVGLFFTLTYEERQNKRDAQLKTQQLQLAEIQTVEKFIPHLTGDEKRKEIAILAISSLGNTELAARLASLYTSEGTVSALTRIAKVGSPAERKFAQAAITEILGRHLPALVKIKTKTDSGSVPRVLGIVVDNAGNILTAHFPLLDQDTSLEVVTWDGDTHEATVKQSDKQAGLALLKLESSSYPPVQLRQSKPKVGDKLLSFGISGDVLAEPQVGEIIDVDEQFLTVEFLDVSSIGPGGGFVVNASSQVVGIIYQYVPTGISAEGANRSAGITRVVCIRGDRAASFLERSKG